MNNAIISYIEVDLLGVSILLLILFNIREKKSDRFLRDQKAFELMLMVNAMLLIFDLLMWIIDKKDFMFARELNIAISSVYYLLNPLICYVWAIYCHYKIDEESKKDKEFIAIMSIPFVVSAILIIVNLFYPVFFTVDSTNTYERAQDITFWLSPILSYVYYVYSIGVCYIKYRNSAKNARDKKYYFSLMLFPLLPFIGSILQGIYYGISLIWICSVVSLLIIFINIQNDRISTDYLTGLYNRRQLSSYLKWKIQRSNLLNKLFFILIDVDEFKRINDVYGHVEGDKALVNVTDVLNKCSRNDGFVARYGGDEFAVVLEKKTEQGAIDFVNEINKYIEEFNSSNKTYKLSLSIGFSQWDCEKYTDIDQFISSADAKMYKIKTEKKALRNAHKPKQI